MSVAAKIGNFFYNTENFYPDHINKNILVNLQFHWSPTKGLQYVFYYTQSEPSLLLSALVR